MSWLPSFSLEVTHLHLSPHQVPVMQTSQIDLMARQVQQLFPHIPLDVLMEDLRLSRSIELTVENVLDGRVTVPEREDTPPPPPPPSQQQPVAEQQQELFSLGKDNVATGGSSISYIEDTSSDSER